jgi:two-component system sensor histidine kinase YesM
MNMRIRNRILLLVFTTLIISFLCSIAILVLSFHIYNSLLNDVVAENLVLSMREFERKLGVIERISMDIMTNNWIQEKMKSVETATSEYERYQIIDEISEKLSAYYSSGNYIRKILLCGLSGSRIIVGCEEQDEIAGFDEIARKAEEAAGKNIWILPADRGSLFSARQIRELSGLRLTKMGIVLISADIERMIQDTVDSLGKYKIVLAILLTGEMAFISDQDFQDVRFDRYVSNSASYQIIDHERERYFLSSSKPMEGQWDFVVLVPYDEIYRRVSVLFQFSILIYSMVFLVFLFIGIRVTRRIIHPIEHLASTVIGIEERDFKFDQEIERAYMESNDEIGTLYREIDVMLGRIKNLINENYKKQLIIKDTQFKTLQAQINPHFLYNTLESINWVAKMNKQGDIAIMTKSLGNILRSSISKRNHVVTVAEEIELITDYLSIQKIRYEDRLQYQIDIPRELYDCAIPKLVLQPIVENSIKYGLESVSGPCMIRIGGCKRNNDFIITVTDNGPGMEKDCIAGIQNGTIETSGLGLGLNNILERLHLVYGSRADLEISSISEKGTSVKIKAPMMFVDELNQSSSGAR